MINPSNSSLVENFNFIANALRRKRKFSDMMSNSISIRQGFSNNNVCFDKENSFMFEDNFNSKSINFETKKRKIKNIPITNDFIYKVEKEFGALKIQKIENSEENDLRLHSENCNSDSLIDNNSDKAYYSMLNNTNSKNFLGKKSKYEANNNFSNSIKNQHKENKSQINSLNQYNYLTDNNKQIYKKNISQNISYEQTNNHNEKQNYNLYNNNNNNITNKQNYSIAENSFNEIMIDIDMNEFKSQPNNQNFFNSDLTDFDTINTSKNTNFEDLSLSFLTEYTNKNVSGNIISNAIETEKLMMKLFDVCNPALQPTEK